jgi:hypothetical protein
LKLHTYHLVTYQTKSIHTILERNFLRLLRTLITNKHDIIYYSLLDEN